jgi:heat shock protein HslJ
MDTVPAYQTGRRRWHNVALTACLILGLAPNATAERGFPYSTEFMLDAKPMKGSKRVPMLVIGPQGDASVEGWCNTVKAHLVVADDTLTILTGAKTEQQCAAERMRGDSELFAALLEVTHWRQEGDVLTLRGPKTLRFRTLTN